MITVIFLAIFSIGFFAKMPQILRFHALAIL